MEKLYFIFLLFTIITCQPHVELSKEDLEPEEDHRIEYIMLFIILGLFFGFCCLWLSEKTGIPYTPLMLLIGLIIGLLENHLWEIGRSFEFVAQIDAHTLLLVFIPPLIFESAFNIDVFVFLQRFWQILILATLGVGMTCVLIAIILRFILQYKDTLDWGESLTIGSILSATDPVAVVAMLKELGTPMKFNILLEGESLFNDGTGTVFFFVFLNVVEVGSFKIANFFEKIFRLALGGPAVGLLMALISYPMLKRLMNIGYVFVLMTIWLAYLTFYICESQFLKIHVSGILALVVLGIYLSHKLRGRIVGHLEEKMHTIWRFIAYILETILFLVTGGYLGDALVNKNLRFRIKGDDVWKVFVFQILLVICRGIVNVILWPLLNVTGDSLSWKDILVMTYAGLRGAIGLSLALYVANSNLRDTDDFENFRVLTIFYVAITIAFTVLVLGVTIKYIIQGIGFVKKTLIQERMKLMIIEKLYKKAVKKKSQLQKMKNLDLVKWNKVDEIMRFKYVYREITKKTIMLQKSSLMQNINNLEKVIYCLDQLIKRKKKEKNMPQIRLPSDEESKVLKYDSDYQDSSYAYQDRSQIQSEIDQSLSIEKQQHLGVMPRQSTKDKKKKKKQKQRQKLSFKISELSNTEDDLSDRRSTSSNDENQTKRQIKKRNEKRDKTHKKMNNLEYLSQPTRAKRVTNIRGEIRMRIYKIVIAQFLERYENHMCLYQSFNKAKYFSKIQEQDLHKKIQYRNLYNTYRSHRWISGMFWKLAHWPLIGGLFKQKFFNGIYQNYDFCSNMVEVLERIKHNKNLVLNLLTQKKQIMREIDYDIQFFKEVISMEFNYDSQSLSWIQTRKALTIIVEALRKELRKFLLRGELSEKEYYEQLKPLKKIEYKINHLSLRTKTKDKNRFAGKFKLKFHFLELNDLSDEEILDLEQKMNIKIYPKDTILFDYKEEISPYVYLVKKGIISVSTFNHPHTKKLGFGEIVGAENVYSNQNQNYAKAVVEREAKVYEVPLRFFQDLCNNHKALEILCKKEESIYRIKNSDEKKLKNKSKFYKQLTKVKSITLKDMLSNHQFHQELQGKEIETSDAIYVYSGQLKCTLADSKDTVLVKADDAIVTCQKTVEILEDSEFFFIYVQPFVKNF